MAKRLKLLSEDMTVTQDLFAYLKRPVFTQTRQPFGRQACLELLRLLGLGVILALIGYLLAGGMYVAIEGGPPEVSEGLKEVSQGPRFFWMAVVFAPLAEEMLFRSWQGKVWGILLAMPILLCLGALLVVSGQSQSMPNLSALLTALILGVLVVYIRRYNRTRSEPRFHGAAAARMFPYIFWGTAIVFALIHISNYAEQGFAPHIVLLVVPQFIIGLILGYVRMRYGLWQAIGYHAAYNAVFVSLSLAGQNAGFGITQMF